nr:hypothetical protein NG677_16545 [Methylobacterium sp. OTU13CASTA1]
MIWPLAAGLSLLATAAFAQVTAPSSPVSDKIQPDAGPPGTGGTLSDRLEKNDGVIKPPGNTAPGMVVRPPDPNPGSMPVIKPGDLPGREPGTEAK